MTNIEAMKLVCPYTKDELRGAFYDGWCNALRQAISETENPNRDGKYYYKDNACTAPPQQGTRAEHSREWVSLTDDEIEWVFECWYSQPEHEVWNTVDVGRAIEAKLKEKNT